VKLNYVLITVKEMVHAMGEIVSVTLVGKELIVQKLIHQIHLVVLLQIHNLLNTVPLGLNQDIVIELKKLETFIVLNLVVN
jgi:hypothetical protein